jgi:geranylgeranyl diphosphate synthase type II
MQAPDALRDHVEQALAHHVLHADLGDLVESMRYAQSGGGKRIRPVICLATAEAAGGNVDDALEFAVAVELVHTFSLVHDDLPALDDDDQRRGRPTAHVVYGDGVALLAGDALLAEAFRLAAGAGKVEPVLELATATLGMIGGQYRDVTGDDADLDALHRLKTGRLFAAAVGLGLWAAEVPEERQAPWRAFGEELGPLFQVVDDLLDADGYVARLGAEAARARAADTAAAAVARLDAIDADTGVLQAIVREMAERTS